LDEIVYLNWCLMTKYPLYASYVTMHNIFLLFKVLCVTVNSIIANCAQILRRTVALAASSGQYAFCIHCQNIPCKLGWNGLLTDRFPNEFWYYLEYELQFSMAKIFILYRWSLCKLHMKLIFISFSKEFYEMCKLCFYDVVWSLHHYLLKSIKQETSSVLRCFILYSIVCHHVMWRSLFVCRLINVILMCIVNLPCLLNNKLY